MTIQLSVVVWTIICFVVLMLILHHLLFKPVLQVMDRRRERMENAAAKKAEYEKIAGEQEAALLKQKAAAYAKQQSEIQDKLEQIRSESKKAIESSKAERLRELDEYRAKAEIERTEILKVLSMHTADLAVSFAESLIKE